MTDNIVTLSNLQEFTVATQGSSAAPVPAAASVLFFWAAWHDLSKPQGQLREIYATIAKKYPSIRFYLVEAEEAADISEKFEVSVVPTFLTFQGSALSGRLEGANPAELSALVKKLNEAPMALPATPIVNVESALRDRLFQLINAAPVVVFIKGTPGQPRCGFSRQIVEILQKNVIEFASFDILTDEQVRQGLKTYSDWPTYPQLYVNGSLVGGLDIVKELDVTGDLKKELGIKEIVAPPPAPTLNDRLKALINQAPVVLFMKGNPETPRCGFSRTIVNILKEEGISFSTFDILSDEEVRQELKTYSDWPTYPQLYVNGSLVGGLDIVNDMKAEGPLKQQLGI